MFSPVALLLLFALALLMPTRSDDLFNGLPMDSAPEVVAILLPVPLLLSSRLRRRWSAGLRGWRSGVVYGLAFAIIVLKALALWAGAEDGFSACYRSPFVPTATSSGCERSFADPLQLSAATRFERHIDVPPAPSLAESSWDFDWSNRLAFNQRRFPVPGIRPPRSGPPRERLPLSAVWTGTVSRSAPRRLLVRYVGEGEIAFGSRSLRLPPSYDAVGEVELARPQGRRDLRASLVFAPTSATGPYAAFQLLDGRTETPIAAAERRPLVGLAVTLAILGVLATLLWPYLRALDRRAFARIAVAVGIAAGVVGLATDSGVALLQAQAAGAAVCVLVLLAAQAARPRPRIVLTAFLALVALLPIAALVADPGSSAVTYHAYGEDWLAYQGHAHEILRTGSLEGGEQVFYYQPAMRYVLFAGHALFGAGDVLPVAVAMALFAMATVLCLTRLVPGFAGVTAAREGVRDRLRRRPELLGALAVAALLLGLVNGGMWWFFRFGASEVPTWLLLPAAVGLLFGPASRAAWAAGSALVGLWAALRLNDLPAAVFLLLLFTLLPGQRRERVAWAVGGLALFLTAVLLHNVVYGSELAFIRAEPMTVDGKTVVGSDSGLSALGNLVAAIWDATARGEVGTNARALLYLDGGLTAENLAQRLVVHGLLLAWLAASAWLVLSWRETTWVAKGMAALPLVVLGPFLAFDVTAYYPRQIVLGYVAMGVSVIYVLGRLDDARLKARRGSRRGFEVRDGASRDEIGAAMDIPDREPLDPALPPGGPDHASTRQL